MPPLFPRLVVTVGQHGHVNEVLAAASQGDQVYEGVGHDGQADGIQAACHGEQDYDEVHAADGVVGDQEAAVVQGD